MGYLPLPTPLSVACSLTPLLHVLSCTECLLPESFRYYCIGMTGGTNNMGKQLSMLEWALGLEKEDLGSISDFMALFGDII